MIYTFYSYKGGVGRSMALANIAELYYQKGNDVIIIDWDIEAPGLERFFDYQKGDLDLYKGLYDLLHFYLTHHTVPDISDYLFDIHKEDKTRSNHLWLMYSGKRSGVDETDYINFVRNFKWEEKIATPFVINLKKQLNKEASIVLIDSRTGYSDANGICTYGLLDMLVCFCSCSIQSIEGLSTILKDIQYMNESDIESAHFQIPLMIVPSRFDVQDYLLNELKDFQSIFFKTFSPYLQHIDNPNSLLDDFGIPYLPTFSFKEPLVVKREEKENKKNSLNDKTENFRLRQAYEKIMSLMDQERYEYDLFLFYHERDSNFCNNLIDCLEKKNIKVCTKDTVLEKGQIKSQTINTLLSKSQYITIGWSQYLKDNKDKIEYGNMIWKSVIKKGITNELMVLMLDNCDLDDHLKDNETLVKYDFSNTKDYESNCMELINRLKKTIL